MKARGDKWESHELQPYLCLRHILSQVFRNNRSMRLHKWLPDSNVCLPARWGFTSAGDRKRIGAFLARMKRRNFLPPQSTDADQLADRADERLFSAVLSNKNHVLPSLLQVIKRPKIYDLRPRAHDYSLPSKHEQNFITRLLYKNIYRW